MPALPPIPHHPDTPSRRDVAGVDLGARAFHCVVLDAAGRIDRIAVTRTVEETVDWLGARTTVGVDAPAQASVAPYAADETLGRKFRTARGCEVVLGREHAVWVPWVTPVDPDALPPWMRQGIDLHRALARAGFRPLEVYPHAIFVLLARAAGLRPGKKASVEGRDTRLALLAAAGVTGLEVVAGSHDLVDAAGAALVARHAVEGRATVARCPLDETEIWLPAAVAEPADAPLGGR